MCKVIQSFRLKKIVLLVDFFVMVLRFIQKSTSIGTRRNMHGLRFLHKYYLFDYVPELHFVKSKITIILNSEENSKLRVPKQITQSKSDRISQKDNECHIPELVETLNKTWFFI